MIDDHVGEAMTKRAFSLSKVYGLLEPGPVVSVRIGNAESSRPYRQIDIAAIASRRGCA